MPESAIERRRDSADAGEWKLLIEVADSAGAIFRRTFRFAVQVGDDSLCACQEEVKGVLFAYCAVVVAD